MKDFVKWLGVNEKISKVVVWIFIIMIMLIIINAALDSMGFPHYQITYNNLKQINTNKFLSFMASAVMTTLNFYATIFLVFRVKNIKSTFPYLIIYLILNAVLTATIGSGLIQIFIAAFMLIFGYLYSNKNKKYIIYMIISMLINTLVQGITYVYKIKFINYATVSGTTKLLLSLDYLIIMGVIILVKEIYLRKKERLK